MNMDIKYKISGRFLWLWIWREIELFCNR